VSNVDALIADLNRARLINRFRTWFAMWEDVQLDLMALGVEPETVMRATQQLLDLATVVSVVNRLDGAPPDMPPAA
jgi:hypothetical protein